MFGSGSILFFMFGALSVVVGQFAIGTALWQATQSRIAGAVANLEGVLGALGAALDDFLGGLNLPL
jgi:hypothetical protein